MSSSRPAVQIERLRGSGAQRDPAAVEVAAGVVAERAGQQAGAVEHLEAVADADDRAPAGDERAQALAEAAAVGRREVEREHAPGAEGVAVAEARRRRRRCGPRRAARAARSARRRARPTARRRRGRARARRRCRGWCPARRRRGRPAGSRARRSGRASSAVRAAADTPAIGGSAPRQRRQVGDDRGDRQRSTGRRHRPSGGSPTVARNALDVVRRRPRRRGARSTRRTAPSPGRRGGARRSSAPRRPPMHISARATARPPSLTSWQARTRSSRIAACRRR